MENPDFGTNEYFLSLFNNQLMAKVNNTHPIADIHGALRRGDKVIFRVRDGIQQAYVVKRPYRDEPSEAQTKARADFKALTAQVKAIYADPAQLAEWQARFEAYTSTRSYKSQLNRYLAQAREPQSIPAVLIPKSLRIPKPPTTLYGFILSSLSKQ